MLRPVLFIFNKIVLHSEVSVDVTWQVISVKQEVITDDV